MDVFVAQSVFVGLPGGGDASCRGAEGDWSCGCEVEISGFGSGQSARRTGLWSGAGASSDGRGSLGCGLLLLILAFLPAACCWFGPG